MEAYRISVIYTTLDTPDHLLALQQQVIKLRLAACTNSFKVSSCYHWEGKVTNDNEIGMLIKTLPEKASALMAYIEQHHPYEVPLITHQTASVNKSYFTWMENLLK